MEIIGWVGTILVIIAYYPQIQHLWTQKCAWGISISTWVIWLASSVLLFIYCAFRHEVLLTIVQVCNMTAIVLTIILVGRANNVCPYHLQKSADLDKHHDKRNGEIQNRNR